MKMTSALDVLRGGVVAFLAIALFGLAPLTTHAQTEEGWVINRFTSAIAIQADGRVEVSETIAVDFGALEKHGIYRDLPEVYQEADGGERYTTIEVTGVEVDGVEATYDVSRNSANLRIKIGDADVTISGPHTYTIRYIATGILSSFGEYDELYWNVTGNGWEVPILMSSASVTLPKVAILQVSCYVGAYGDDSSCDQATDSGSTATFTQKTQLEPGEGLTIAVGYEKGAVPILIVEGPTSVGELVTGSPVPAIIFVLTLFLGLNGLYRFWRKRGRDIGKSWRSSQIVVEYEPPQNLRPAEIGVLMDETADTIDVSATIVDLAVRGYLEITEIKKEGLFAKLSGPDYQLTKKKIADSTLHAYEQTLLTRLFETGDELLLSSLKEKFYKDLSEIKDMLYKHVVEKQFFASNPTTARLKHFLMAFALFVPAFILTINGISTSLSDGVRSVLIALGPAVFVIAVAYLIVAIRGMPQRTALGLELYRKAQGYKEFITHVETHRQRFFERENIFMEVLPYAIIFGATKKLADAMKVMGVNPPAPTWYHGAVAFNIASFSDSVGSFSRSLSSTMASAPSSSGSGGGGSSGGGGGGGGGGSW